ncbi:MAG TPA: cupredoxin domain-containing protein [Longimicrobium sp.]|nr:cupredoxin domain-containing protein [Longimicrobium sp.]
MSAIEWMVVLAGLAAIIWVNWYFFLSHGPAAQAAAGAGGVQEVTIAVQGGYSPSQVRVKKGTPVRLVFDRQETSSCSEEIVIPEFGIRRFLPAFQKTAVEIQPQRAGTYDFACGMSMLHGKLIVED